VEPVMNAKMIFAAVLLATPPLMPALAQDGIRAQLGSCLAIPGVLQRLACYDSVAKGNGITGAARAPVAAAPVAAAPMAAAPRTALNASPPRAPGTAEGFGAERLPRVQAERQAVGEITSAVTDLSYSISGKFTVTLANGQVWRQKEGDVTAKFFQKQIRTATISRGVLSSYNLVFNSSGTFYKVARVR
jgi:hypothetical protein